MTIVFIFVNIFLVGILIMKLFGSNGGSSGPFCKKRRRNHLVIALSSAFIGTVFLNVALWIH